MEEQALSRIHRIGQRREVTTVRFFVSDTFEEVSEHRLSGSPGRRFVLTRLQRVMKVQEDKKDLASVLFSAHDDNQTGSLERLKVRGTVLPASTKPMRLTVIRCCVTCSDMVTQRTETTRKRLAGLVRRDVRRHGVTTR